MTGFTYSCIGDNTPENREWLEKLGMTRAGNIIGNIIMVNSGRYMCLIFEGEMRNNFNDAVKCIGNPALFQAVTAIRDDSDYMQLFFMNDDSAYEKESEEAPVLCESDNIEVDLAYDLMYIDWHKATLAELQEHFKHV